MREPTPEIPEGRRRAGSLSERIRDHVTADGVSSSAAAVALLEEAAAELDAMSRRELDNHHAADMCPYCTPDPEQRRQAETVDLVSEFLAERDGL